MSDITEEDVMPVVGTENELSDGVAEPAADDDAFVTEMEKKEDPADGTEVNAVSQSEADSMVVEDSTPCDGNALVLGSLFHQHQ